MALIGLVARSTPFWEAERVSPFDFVKMKVLCGKCQVWIVHLRSAPSLSKGLTRSAASPALSVFPDTQADYLGEAPVILL